MNTLTQPSRASGTYTSSNVLDVMASMFVDYVFEMGTTKPSPRTASGPTLSQKQERVTAGPRDPDVDEGAYMDDEKERTAR